MADSGGQITQDDGIIAGPGEDGIACNYTVVLLFSGNN